MAWPLIIMGAVALASGIAKGIAANKQKKKQLALQKEAGQYEENPLARQQLALAQNLYEGRMEGASALEQNIFAAQANTQANIERNATDASQVLALQSGLQGNTDQALSDLQRAESADRKDRYGMLVNAQGNLIHEQDKVFGDKMRVLDQKMAIYGVAAKNTQDAIGDMASGVSMVAGGVAGGYANKSAGYNFNGNQYLGGGGGSINPYMNNSRPWYYNQPVATMSSYGGGGNQSIYANSYPG